MGVPADLVTRNAQGQWSGPLGDLNNRYLGVRFTTTNGVHYGWIRLTTGWVSASVQEWAYETQPDIPVRAGETGIPASNDQFAARRVLEGDYLEATANNSRATAEAGEPDHAGLSAGASLWWTWTAPTNGWVTLSSTQGAFGPCFAVYRGSDLPNLGLVAFSQVRCAEQGWGWPSINQTEIFHVAAGETYQIAFDSPRALYNDYDPPHAPRGQIRFSLDFSTVEITSPTNGATFFTDSLVTFAVDTGPTTGLVALEMDGQTIAQSESEIWPPPPFVHALGELPPGSHILRARMSEFAVSVGANFGGPRVQWSPPVTIQVRPANDDFARATTLVGTNFGWSGNTYNATAETNEPVHPAGHDGFTVWYRWTAPEDGVARIAIPTGGGVALTIFQGDNLTNLQMVAANPIQDHFFAMTAPLHPLLHFATRAGEVYAIQVSSRWWGVPTYQATTDCEPPWITGSPFQMNLEFVPRPVGKLDMVFSPGVPNFVEASRLFFFAAAPDSRFILETSTDLAAWEAASGVRTATGATEILRVPDTVAWPARFWRVRLER